MESIDRIRQLLKLIYGESKGSLAASRILALIESFPVRNRKQPGYFSQEDVVLITYGDTLKQSGKKPLAVLYEFAERYLRGVISCIHFLPFFPYSSDDGFSVTDFLAVDPELGTWKDLRRFGNDFKMMFDYVVNHFSSKSPWFESYLSAKPGFEDFAIEVDPATDLSRVTRPRSLPLLTEYKKADGTGVHLWTTFSADQIDFNFKSLNVLEKMVMVLLAYVKQGASILRLDAIAYLWKEIGTDCIHLGQTHYMVKLFRCILDLVAPDVMLLTETNVPHHENISYFGNGRDEAQMVYNFTLPPLLLYSFVRQDADLLSNWAKGLHLESETNTFLDFTASHDGIGVRPLEGILPRKDVDDLIDVVKTNGGQVSYKRNADGSESAYELNITYVDAILADCNSRQTQKFLASQAIQYALPGVPATYIHSLLGSRNWSEGVRQTGRARAINREKLQIEDLTRELNDPDSFRSKIFHPYLKLIKVRRAQPAFHPNAGFEVLDIDSRVFALKRFCSHQTVYALTNISSQPITVSLCDLGICDRLTDLLTGQSVSAGSFQLKPYQFGWLSSVPKPEK